MQRCRIFEKMARVFFLYIIFFIFILYFILFFFYIYNFFYIFFFYFIFILFYYYFILFYFFVLRHWRRLFKGFFFWIGKRTSMAPRWSRDPMQMKGTKKKLSFVSAVTRWAFRFNGKPKKKTLNQLIHSSLRGFLCCGIVLFHAFRVISDYETKFFYSGGWKRKLRWKYLTHQKGNVWPILVAKINPSNLMAPESRSKVFHLKWISFYAHVDRKFRSKVPPVGLIDWSRDVMRQPITCEACGKWIFVFFSKNTFLNFREFV